MSRHHNLKLNAEYFDNAESGKKMFEIRYNDRDFQVGDTISLHCWDKCSYDSSRKPLNRKIVYTSTFQQKEGWIVLGLVEVSDGMDKR